MGKIKSAKCHPGFYAHGMVRALPTRLVGRELGAERTAKTKNEACRANPETHWTTTNTNGCQQQPGSGSCFAGEVKGACLWDRFNG